MILVQWDPPEPANGNITLYIISYYPVSSPGDRNETNVSGTDTEVSIENLTPFTDYTFLVSAVTVAEGPQAEVNAITSESGLLLIYSLSSAIQSCYIYIILHTEVSIQAYQVLFLLVKTTFIFVVIITSQMFFTHVI